MEEQKSTITLKKTTLWKAISGILFLLLLASIYTSGFGLFDNTPTGGTVVDDNKPAPKPTEPDIVKFDTSKWDLSDEPFMGKADAPVTIIEYSDFECPFCKRAVDGGLKQVVEEYVDTGKAKLYFRHYPLPFHSKAQAAAEATECANEQGKFWEMHDKIFENQASLSRANLITWADELGITEMKECLDSGKYTDEVKNDMAEGQQGGVQGTPAFFINGRLVVGAIPFEDYQGRNGMEQGLQSVIEEALNN
jgi:protein-disulfide isomerase